MNLREALINRITRRPADQVIGGFDRPYMLRWYVIPKNRLFNIYLHCFLRSDDDRALHDHPWINMSILLRGAYLEHTIAAGGVHHLREVRAGSMRLRRAGFAHRIELHEGSCWSLFLTGPKTRAWGFHCPQAGWVHWRDFAAPDNPGEVGRGCDQ